MVPDGGKKSCCALLSDAVGVLEWGVMVHDVCLEQTHVPPIIC